MDPIPTWMRADLERDIRECVERTFRLGAVATDASQRPAALDLTTWCEAEGFGPEQRMIARLTVENAAGQIAAVVAAAVSEELIQGGWIRPRGPG